MKKLITLLAIFVGMIPLIVIADSTEFECHDSILSLENKTDGTYREQTFVSNSTPTMEMLTSVALSAAVETGSAQESESGNEVFSLSAKPAKEISSFAPPPPTDETTDVMSVTSAKQAFRQAPVAVPILTPKDAKRANMEAKKYQRKKAIAKTIKSIENNNTINFIISLFPLLLIIDIIFIKRKNKKEETKRETSRRRNEYFSLSRRMRILFSVSLLAFGILVFVPWSVYFGNSFQFPFIFQDFVNWNLRVLTISIVGSCIILLLIPSIISDYLVAVVAGLGLCVYVQAMFMNQHLGTMDGIEPEWNEHRIFGAINIIIWIIIVLSPVVLKKVIPSLFSQIISAITCFILVLELLATVSMVVSAGQNVWSRTDTFFIDGSKQFQLSKEKNVVVIVMDALGSGYLEKCFELYPETKTIVKDFTWYKDARSNYQSTFPGLTHELTGAFLVTPGKDYKELFDKTWHSASARSFYKQVSDAGYDTRLFISKSADIFGPIDCFHEYFSNIDAKDITYIIDYERVHFCLKQMLGFSCAPYLFKKHFFYSFDFSDGIVEKQVSDIPPDKKNSPSSNSEFLSKMISSGISSDANMPILSFHYIIGAHKPWIYDEKCNKVEVPFEDPLPSALSCLFILSEFIRLLKKADIYDNTAILICSDHGAYGAQYHTPCDMTFMIKPFHENKAELSIDYSCVQSIDILPTLLKIICGDEADFKDFDGYPSFNIPDGRIRKVYKLDKNKDFPDFDGWGNDYYNCLNEYNFVDLKSFSYSKNSKSFVRQIPFVNTSQEQ